MILGSCLVIRGQEPAPAATPQTPDEIRAAAQTLFSEGKKLYEEKTPGPLTAAIEKLSQAAALFQKLDDKKAIAEVFYYIGSAYSSLGANQKALDYLRQSLLLFREINDKSRQISILYQIGGVHNVLGEKTTALEYFKYSLSLATEVNDQPAKITTLNDLCLVYSDLGMERRALEYCNQANALSKRLNINNSTAVSTNNIGTVWADQGKYVQAVEYFSQALAISPEVEAYTTNNLGIIYAAQGKNQEALGNFEKSLRLFREKGEINGEVQVLSNLGAFYSKGGDTAQAIDYFTRASILAKKTGNKNNEALASANIGGLYLALGKKEEADAYFKHVVALNTIIQGASGTEARVSSQDYDDGIKSLITYLRVMESLKQSAARAEQAQILTLMTGIAKSIDMPYLAILYSKQAVDIYQSLRSEARSGNQQVYAARTSLSETAHRQLADMLMAQRRFVEAEQILDLLKEEEYSTFVRRDAGEIQNLKRRPELKPEERKLLERYDSLANKVTEIDAEFRPLDAKKNRLPEGETLPPDEQNRHAKLSGQLAVANEAFRLFLEKELAVELGEQKKQEINVDRSLQDALRRWGEGTVLLYTVVTNNRYRVVLTTENAQVDGKTEIDASKLEKMVIEFRQALRNPLLDPRPAGKALYNVLIQPIEADLKKVNAKTLVWSLDGVLRLMPVSALSPDGETYLAKKYQNVIITAATRQKLDTVNEKDWHVLGLGVSTKQTVSDPDSPEKTIEFHALSGVRDEIGTIVRDEQVPDDVGLLEGRSLMDNDFDLGNFSGLLGKIKNDGKRKYSIVHLASHFRLGNSMANSFLLIGSGNILTLADISSSPNIRFGDVELVTLAACNTALGDSDTFSGKEVDSLATFMEFKGAKSVMATLWPVQDESTSILMNEFYRLHSESPEKSKAALLQEAQIQMIDGKLKSSGKPAICRTDIIDTGPNAVPFKCDTNAPFSHPYFWSPFILIGNWR